MFRAEDVIIVEKKSDEGTKDNFQKTLLHPKTVLTILGYVSSKGVEIKSRSDEYV